MWIGFAHNIYISILKGCIDYTHFYKILHCKIRKSFSCHSVSVSHYYVALFSNTCKLCRIAMQNLSPLVNASQLSLLIIISIAGKFEMIWLLQKHLMMISQVKIYLNKPSSLHTPYKDLKCIQWTSTNHFSTIVHTQTWQLDCLGCCKGAEIPVPK